MTQQVLSSIEFKHTATLQFSADIPLSSALLTKILNDAIMRLAKDKRRTIWPATLEVTNIESYSKTFK